MSDDDKSIMTRLSDLLARKNDRIAQLEAEAKTIGGQSGESCSGCGRANTWHPDCPTCRKIMLMGQKIEELEAENAELRNCLVDRGEEIGHILHKMADAEDAAGSTSVGGLAADMGMVEGRKEWTARVPEQGERFFRKLFRNGQLVGELSFEFKDQIGYTQYVLDVLNALADLQHHYDIQDEQLKLLEATKLTPLPNADRLIVFEMDGEPRVPEPDEEFLDPDGDIERASENYTYDEHQVLRRLDPATLVAPAQPDVWKERYERLAEVVRSVGERKRHSFSFPMIEQRSRAYDQG